MLYIWYVCVYVCLCALFMHVQKSIGLSLFLLQLQCLGGVHELFGCPGHRGFLCWSYFLLGLQNWDGSKSHVLQLHNLVLHVLQQLTTVRSKSQQRLTVIHRDCDICDRPAEWCREASSKQRFLITWALRLFRLLRIGKLARAIRMVAMNSVWLGVLLESKWVPIDSFALHFRQMALHR